MKSSRNVSTDYSSYLNDESGLINDGGAEEIFFPENETDIIDLVKRAKQSLKSITVSGGGTGISGGRVPVGGWILATDDMNSLTSKAEGNRFLWQDNETNREFEVEFLEDFALLKVPVSISVKEIQNLCRQFNWFYPPDPTERTAYIGGNVVTNASGARSFKFGPTRNWVHALRVVLADGSVINLDRNDSNIGDNTNIHINNFLVPRPTYKIQNTTKNVAGPVITENSRPIDVFIGTEGIFGIITEITLKLIKPPKFITSIFAFVSDVDQAIQLAKVTQKNRQLSQDPIPMSVEYLDEKAVNIMKARDGSIDQNAKHIVILEQDASSEEQLYSILEKWQEIFDQIGISETSVAQTHAQIEHHKFLRHLIPETINAQARSNGQPKLGTDYSAPVDKMNEMFSYAKGLGEEFKQQSSIEDNKIAYAIWSHFGDNHVHLNFLPQNNEEKLLAKSLMLRFMKQVVAWNGSIAAEHGLGKKVFDNKPAAYIQLGENGVQEIRTMKTVLDPNNLLNPGNIID